MVDAAGLHARDDHEHILKDLGQVGLWLSTEGLEAAQLDEERVAAFRNARRAAGHRKVPGPRAMVPLLSYLRGADIASAAKPLLTPLGGLLGQFRSWLVQERGLAPTTVLRYENTARRFLQVPLGALQASSIQALQPYATLRNELQPRPKEPSFFASLPLTRKRLLYGVVCQTFRQLIDTAGVGAGAPCPPRLHDYADLRANALVAYRITRDEVGIIRDPPGTR